MFRVSQLGIMTYCVSCGTLAMKKDQSFTALILQSLAHMQIRRLEIHFFIKPLRLFIMGEYM